ncbi:MAG: hypothetical protein V4558_07170 [Gemmatimonadota bacterium]
MKGRTLIAVLIVAAVPMSVHGQAPPRWPVMATPVTSIGDASDDERQELLRVGGARRLSDGRVLVSNGKPHELRVYNAQGKFLSRIGRSGGGPGEFQGRIDILSVRGDTVVLFDQGSMRWSEFLVSGKLLQESKAGPGTAPAQVALYRRTLVRDLPNALNHCAVELLDALVAVPPPALREALPDGAGRFWVRLDTSPVWSVYSPAGRPVASVQLPAGLELFQVTDGFVVGRLKDRDDVERVVVLRVNSPRAVGSRARCEGVKDTLPAATGPRLAELKGVMRSAMTAAEMAYSDVGHYVSTADSLQLKLPADVRFRILRSTAAGWAAVVFDLRSTLACTFGIGDAAPLGWPEGMLRCGP